MEKPDDIFERRRKELEKKFKKVPGVKKVYFQPPKSTKMEYDCIRYERARGDSEFANNLAYRFTQCYTVYVIYRDPTSPIAGYIATHFPMCELSRHYVSDNLHHEVLTLYY